MFVLKDFIKRGLIEAIGRKPTYQIILDAAGWLDKGVLSEDDLAEIENAIDVTREETEAGEDNEHEAM